MGKKMWYAPQVNELAVYLTADNKVGHVIDDLTTSAGLIGTRIPDGACGS